MSWLRRYDYVPSPSYYSSWTERDALRQDRELREKELRQQERHHRELIREMRRRDMTPEERTFEEKVYRAKQELDMAQEWARFSCSLGWGLLLNESDEKRAERRARDEEHQRKTVESIKAAADALRDILANPPEGSKITEWLLP